MDDPRSRTRQTLALGTMPRILVVYHSRTGFTQTVARQIARGCGADLERIVDAAGHDRPGDWRCALDAVLGRGTGIAPSRHAPGDYDLVVVGTPVWCWRVAAPVRSWLQRHRDELRRLAFFCTENGAGQDRVFRDMKRLCGRAPELTLAVRDRDIIRRAHRSAVRAFVAGLQQPPGLLRNHRRRRLAALGGGGSTGLQEQAD